MHTYKETSQAANQPAASSLLFSLSLSSAFQITLIDLKMMLIKLGLMYMLKENNSKMSQMGGNVDLLF